MTTSWPSSRPLMSNPLKSSRSHSPFAPRQARACLVPTLDRRQPYHAAQAGPTRPPGPHERPDQRGDPVAHRGSAPPRCCRLARGGKRDKGVGPPPTNSPVHHSCGERYYRNINYDPAAPHHPLLPQREEYNGPKGRFIFNLRR